MPETSMKKQALLIGINEYQILPGLKYARQDAEAVADALKQNYGFSDNEVMLLTDAKPGLFKPTNRYIIQDHLEKLASQELDLFIFGFWGHGLFRNGKRYLCPLDVMGNRAEHQGLPFDELQELLANIHAKNTCLILDCRQTICDQDEAETHTSFDQTSMKIADQDVGQRRKTQIPNFQSNVAILNSCKEGQCAYEWDARQHGLFTAHLLDAMNKRCTSVLQIVSYISSNIENTAMELGKEQTPFYKFEGDIQLPVSSISQSPEIVHSPKPENSNNQKPVVENKNTTVPPAQIERRQPIQYQNLPPTSRSSFKWDGTKITKFIGKERNVVIPEGVSEIGRGAFYGCTSLTSVVIPESVTKIGVSAFYGCSSLTSVVIPESVTKIGTETFMDCISLTSVVIPECVTKIGDFAFADCSSLTSVAIFEGVQKIGDRAFSGCSSLTSVEIPKSVKEIGGGAFAGCLALKEWAISSSHPYFKRDGVALLTKDGKKLVACLASAKDYQIPEGVTEIGEGAFKGCSSLTSMVIPVGVTKIEKDAFRDCRFLISVVIPEGVSEIGWGACYGCISLTSVVIPEGVTNIGDGAFEDCSSLTSVVIPKSVTKIGDNAFKGCISLTSVVIPVGVTEIGGCAFADCSSIISVVIPEGVTKIGNCAFSGCKSLKSVFIPEGVTEIGSCAFSGCSSLTSVVIPEGVTKIEDLVFEDCSSLTSVVIPEGVTEIGRWAFADCSSLTSVIIPKSVKKIGEKAFSNCPVPMFSRAWRHNLWDNCKFWE